MRGLGLLGVPRRSWVSVVQPRGRASAGRVNTPSIPLSSGSAVLGTQNIGTPFPLAMRDEITFGRESGVVRIGRSPHPCRRRTIFGFLAAYFVGCPRARFVV